MLLNALFKQNRIFPSFQIDFGVILSKIKERLIKSKVITNSIEVGEKTIIPYYTFPPHITFDQDHEFHDALDQNDGFSPDIFLHSDEFYTCMAYPKDIYAAYNWRPAIEFLSQIWISNGISEQLISDSFNSNTQDVFGKLFISEYTAIAAHPIDGFIQYIPYIDVLENLMLAQFLSGNEILPIELMSIVADHISTDRAIDYKDYTYESLYSYIFSDKNEGSSYIVNHDSVKTSREKCEIHEFGTCAYLRHAREWKLYPLLDFGENVKFYLSHGYSTYKEDNSWISEDFPEIIDFLDQKIHLDSIRVFGWVNLCFYLRASNLIYSVDPIHGE